MRLLVLVLALGALACSTASPDRVAVRLRLPSAPDCAPSGRATTNILALGDFPTSDSTVEVVDGEVPREIGSFPRTTLALSARVTSSGWDAFGTASVSELRVVPDLLLLPVGRACSVGDSEARLPPGAAVAVASSSSLFIAGGLDARGRATRRLAVLELRTEHVDLPSQPLIVTTAFASATLAPGGASVVVAGGAGSADGDVHDTWENVALEGGSTAHTLAAPRRDHAAVALGGALGGGAVRGVVLVGGTDGDVALDTIEVIDVDAGTSRMASMRLSTPRRSPSILVLSPDRIAVFGGTRTDGTAATGIDLVDLAAGTSERAAADPGAGDWAVALPNGRIAIATPRPVEPPDEPTECTVHVVLDGGARSVEAGIVPRIASPVAIALASGRVLVAGRDARGERIAAIFSPSTGLAEPIAMSLAPDVMVVLPDGVLVALDASLASMRRDDRLTPFDSPRPLILFADDRDELMLDASARFAVEGDVLVAREVGARLDVPVQRFRDVSIVLDATGASTVLLVDALGQAHAEIAITGDAVSAGSCRLARTSTTAVRIVRRGDAIQLEADGQQTTCSVGALPERVGIAIRASDAASLPRLRSLALARL